MEKTLANLPVNALSEIMGKLSLKNATSLGSTSRSTRALLERTHPKRYKGPPDYTKGKGKYQKEYDEMQKTLDGIADKLFHDRTLTKRKIFKARQQCYLYDHAFVKAKEAYEKHHLVYTLTRYWKKAANLKKVYKGLLKHLETMGKAYEPTGQALRKKQPQDGSDETQAHKVMDALIKYIPAGAVK
jgi:hypothetical protein